MGSEETQAETQAEEGETAMSGQRPNIVFILADDMGYGDFSAFNDGLTKTPTLDELMGEGICLTQQFTASPVCNPSRAALMTGRYPHRTGSVDTLEWRGLERLALRETTIADVLKAAGYTTGLVGKWHLGAFDRRYHPMRRGFDETVCFRGGMHDYYRWRIEHGETRWIIGLDGEDGLRPARLRRFQLRLGLMRGADADRLAATCAPRDFG